MFFQVHESLQVQDALAILQDWVSYYISLNIIVNGIEIFIPPKSAA